MVIPRHGYVGTEDNVNSLIGLVKSAGADASFGWELTSAYCIVGDHTNA